MNTTVLAVIIFATFFIFVSGGMVLIAKKMKVDVEDYESPAAINSTPSTEPLAESDGTDLLMMDVDADFDIACDDGFESTPLSHDTIREEYSPPQFDLGVDEDEMISGSVDDEDLLADFEDADYFGAAAGMPMPASRPKSLKSRLKSWLGKNKPVVSESQFDSPTIVLGSDSGNSSDKNIGPSTDSLSHVVASKRGEYVDGAPSSCDAVDCTVFAPPTTQIGHQMIVQAFVHIPERAEEARSVAQEFDDEAVRRGVTSLGTQLARGAKLQFELIIRSLEIDEPVQELTWNGRTESVEFEVIIPKDTSTGTTIGKLLVTQNSIPIGTIRFKITIDSSSSNANDAPEPVGHANRYRKAFISYASKDRAEVIRRTQMLSAAGIGFFQDIFDLRAGDKWSEKLYQHIDESDVLFLFWSTAAKESAWVQKEWRYALEKKGEDFIRPVILEGPPIYPPPLELEHLHFNDRALYYLAAEK